VNRRVFLRAGVAASVLPFSMGERSTSTAEATADGRSLHLYAVVFDSRFPESVAFADETSRLGVPARGMDGDITNFWFNELGPRWKAGPAAIAGVTAYGPLFCLERLAWEHGMRVILEGRHLCQEGGTVEHALWGPAGLATRASALDTAGPHWPRRVAHLALQCCHDRLPAFTPIPSHPPAIERDRTRQLCSWVIGPVAPRPRS
jgi:hypothetical protein